ncbi:MAG: DUF547 domain-containing protein [Candidatus Binatia bacterium]|nr:MAG: DUF547 domain-containing protein [Candidatus Binatia bacterium]
MVAAFVAAAGHPRTVRGQESNGEERQPRVCPQFDHEHAAWTAILQRYVSGGWVSYTELRDSGMPDLRRYLASLEAVCREDFDAWTEAEKLAFWINAYNAYTVKLILDHYPVKSIRSIGLLPGAAFRERFIPLQNVRGHLVSLNEIEHEILRREFREPRIHFAIVCASKSCPALRSEAYRASRLDDQLDDAARTFLRDVHKNRFDPVTRTLYLSSIFRWFREDFERAASSLPAFVAPYFDRSTAAEILAPGVKVEFLDYDWSLNGR